MRWQHGRFGATFNRGAPRSATTSPRVLLDSWLGHSVILAGVAVYSLIITWRKWPDALVDSGRELYTAWRLSQGAVLYRDVDCFYGPLSQYFNAALFSLFGTGMMVLVWANIAIFVALLFVVYATLRRAWDPRTALVGSAVFILVFGFSRFSKSGSFNYAAPYSHEVTHGMLVLLLLSMALDHWRRCPTAAIGFAAGLLCGLTFVLKPEIALSGMLVTALYLFHGWRTGWSRAAMAGAWFAGSVLPVVAFTFIFVRDMPFTEAASAAVRALQNVVGTTRYVSDPAQLHYLGLDAPAQRVKEHIRAVAVAFGVILAIGGAAFLVSRTPSAKLRAIILAVTVVSCASLAWSASVHRWVEVGKCLFGVSAAYLFVQLAKAFRGEGDDRRQLMRAAFALLAVSLMVRMVLNGRIYQFGFYQAALAAVLVVVVLLGELPRIGGACRTAHATAYWGAFVIIASGTWLLADQNRRTHALITHPMGEGRDRFYVFRPEVVWTTPLVADITAELAKLPRDQTLLVLPEGLMVNYLTRMRSPLPHFFYYSVVTEHGREAKLVFRLAETPPDWVLLVPRDLEEYGIRKYGERPGAGAELLSWVKTRYESVGAIQGTPLTYETHRVQLFRRRD